MWLLVFQQVVVEALLDLIYFPLWWYTGGAAHAAGWCFNLFKFGNASLAPGLWLKNIFTPMYGQYDIEGRIISFVMRSIQIIARGLALLVWLVFCFILFLVWLVLPVIVAWGIIASFK